MSAPANKMAETPEYQERTTCIIAKPEELRRFLLDSMVKLVEGKITVSMANAVIGLSGEVHKSVRQEWEMHCYAADNIAIAPGKVIAIEVIESDGPDDG